MTGEHGHNGSFFLIRVSLLTNLAEVHWSVINATAKLKKVVVLMDHGISREHMMPCDSVHVMWKAVLFLCVARLFLWGAL